MSEITTSYSINWPDSGRIAAHAEIFHLDD